jgi:DNA-binding NtrC family response regulator
MSSAACARNSGVLAPVARVLVLTADLLFGSNVQGALTAAGHEVELAGGEDALREALLRAPADVVVADLTSEELERVQSVRELREEGLTGSARLLGYYSHVEPGVRALAEGDGFDLVVPRSRMAREGAELITTLTEAGN